MMRAISAADRPHLLPPSTETTQKKGKEREDKETFNNVMFRSAFSRCLVNTASGHGCRTHTDRKPAPAAGRKRAVYAALYDTEDLWPFQINNS